MKQLIQLGFKSRYFATRVQSIHSQSASSLAEYYSYLLATAPLNNNGRMKIIESQVATFINLVSEKEIKKAIEAFNNLLGHNTYTNGKLMDRFMTKCIEYNEIPYVLDVMKHHAALRYFPSPDIIHNLIAKLNDEQVLQFVNLLRTKLFIKMDQKTLDSLIRDDAAITYQIYRIALDRQITLSGPSLYAIARNFITKENIRKAEFMIEFASQNTNTEDPYTQLSLLFTYFYLQNIEQTVLSLAKIMNQPEGKQVIQKEREKLQPLLDALALKVAEDEKWKNRLNELLDRL